MAAVLAASDPLPPEMAEPHRCIAVTPDRPDMLVLRPVRYMVLLTTIALGLVAVFCLILSLAFFIGHQLFGLFWLGLTLASLIFANEVRKMRLWADADSVGLSQFFQRARCPRSELASVRVGAPIGRSGPPAEFVRTNGSVAFRTPVSVWGRDQLATLARYVGVPFVDPTLRSGYLCPVCGFHGLDEPVRRKEGEPGSHEICPSCGFEFGGAEDQGEPSYEAWRQQWIAGGMTWWAAGAGRQPPAYWDPKQQLDNLTDGGR